jgi:mono/diheme cytochrome c family protein
MAKSIRLRSGDRLWLPARPLLCKNLSLASPTRTNGVHHLPFIIDLDEETADMRRASTVAVAGSALAYAVLLAVSLSAQNGSAEGRKMKNPVASNTESINAGRAAYQKYCRFCHGADALGDGPSAPKDSHPSNLTDKAWTRGSSDGEIFVVVRDGAGPKFDMKGFKGRMTDQDIWNVVNYIRSIAKK